MSKPFTINSGTFKIDVTSTASTTKVLAGGNHIRVVNDGNFTCFISVGIGSQTATVPTTTSVSTCTPIMSGEDLVFSMTGTDITSKQISAICNSGEATTLYVSIGEGE